MSGAFSGVGVTFRSPGFRGGVGWGGGLVDVVHTMMVSAYA